jgi:two-component system, chemotaxis family, response regulator Rcp1
MVQYFGEDAVKTRETRHHLPASHLTEPALDMNPIELLMVDDNAAETLLLLYALEDCPRPINFHFAKDGVEALEMLKQETFDLVILDLNLPGLSGYDVLEQCDPRQVPVVVFSVSSNQAHAKRALELGAREFVHKPDALELYRHAVLKMIETWVLNESKSAGAGNYGSPS